MNKKSLKTKIRSRKDNLKYGISSEYFRPLHKPLNKLASVDALKISVDRPRIIILCNHTKLLLLSFFISDMFSFFYKRINHNIINHFMPWRYHQQFLRYIFVYTLLLLYLLCDIQILTMKVIIGIPRRTISHDIEFVLHHLSSLVCCTFTMFQAKM